VPFGNSLPVLGWVWCATTGCWNPCQVIVSLVYQVARKLLAVPAVLLRRDVAKEAELLVLRHENAVLRRTTNSSSLPNNGWNGCVTRTRRHRSSRPGVVDGEIQRLPQRFVHTVRSEVTDRILIVGQHHLRRTLDEYARHYNRRRPHRALDLRPPRSDRHGSFSPTSGSNGGQSSGASSPSTNTPYKRPAHRRRQDLQPRRSNHPAAIRGSTVAAMSSARRPAVNSSRMGPGVGKEIRESTAYPPPVGCS
jgi:hypothetical protein